jgi:hypothetical protein
MDNAAPGRPFWKKALAGILDFALVFGGGGYLIAMATGGLTDGGFSLQGAPALGLFALVILYFVIFNKYLGGTIFKRLIG